MEEREPPRDWPHIDEDFVASASYTEKAATERRLEHERQAAAERAARLRAEEAAVIDRARRRQRREHRRGLLGRALGWKLISLAGVIALGFIGYHALHRSKPVPAAAVRTPAGVVPTTVRASTRSLPRTSTTVQLEERQYQPGDCVTWDQSGGNHNPWGRPTQILSCDKPHLVEMVAPSQQITGFGADWPGARPLEDYVHQHCLAPAQAFLGYPVDPHGRFVVSAILPSEQGWVDGGRTYWCDIETYQDASGSSSPFTGEVRGADQEWIVPIGACMTTGTGYPVPCSGPHQWETTADVTVPAGTTSMPTSDQGWQQLIGAQCDQAGLRYVGGTYPPGYQTGWLPLAASSWAAGERVVQCFVGRPLYSGTSSSWATTTGSVHHI